MATTVLGKVVSPRGKHYEVRWDPVSKDVYTKCTGGLMPLSAGPSTKIAQATTAQEAMIKAEASVYDK